MSRIILVYFIIILLSKSHSNPLEGPYKSVVTSLEDCGTVSHPYASPRSISYTAEVYNVKKRQLFKGNVTCKSGIHNKITITKYTYEGGKYVKHFQIKDLDCKTTLIKVIYKSLNIKYNKKTCKLEPGSYSFKDLDFDYINHMVVQTRVYGKIQLGFQTASNKGIEVCLCIKADILPVNNTYQDK